MEVHSRRISFDISFQLYYMYRHLKVSFEVGK